MFVDEGRNVIADVEDEPDGEKAGDAVNIDLQKIANDVAVEKTHRYRVTEAPLSLAHLARHRTRGRDAKSQAPISKEAPMFKLQFFPARPIVI